MLRSRGTGPRATVKNGPLHRRAWALACHTRMRAGFPRHAAIAGDRPPRYDEKNAAPSRRARACPSPSLVRQARCLPTLIIACVAILARRRIGAEAPTLPAARENRLSRLERAPCRCQLILRLNRGLRVCFIRIERNICRGENFVDVGAVFAVDDMQRMLAIR